MAPALAYGRHRGPARRGSRIAAVAVTLYQDAGGQWMLPLTLRPDAITHHAGQISLPGGRLEPGETNEEAAVREFEEELGIRPSIRQRCGELSTQFVHASDHRVHPVVLVIEPPRTPWQPDPAEVDEVIELPLATLLNPGARFETVQRKPLVRDGRTVDELTFRTPAFQIHPRPIWGATAVILDELLRRLQLAPPLHNLQAES